MPKKKASQIKIITNGNNSLKTGVRKELEYLIANDEQSRKRLEYICACCQESLIVTGVAVNKEI
jgi:hypothetical protein